VSTVYDLLATLGIDASDYDSGLQGAEGRADEFSSTISGLGAVGGGILAGGLMAGGAAAAFLGMELGAAVGEATEAQDIFVVLDTIIGNTGDTTGVTISMVNDLANSFSTLTKYSDDEILSAEGVIARFDQINSTAFPQALSLSMDLATVMGTDLSSAALTVAKALAIPGEGLLRLKQAGVAFSDAETEMIQKMMDAGDTAGAQAFIMQTLEDSIGGTAEAAGGTASGQWRIFKNLLDNVLETVGTGLLPALTGLGATLTDYVARPETQAIIQGIADAIGDFANQVINWLPQAVEWIQNAFGWLSEHQGVIIGALAVIGVAIAAFVYTTVIPAAIAAISAIAPILLIMAAVAGVVWLVYEAWTNNWGGIRDKLMEVWAVIQPVLQTVWNWLATNIPLAVQAMANWWSTVLVPALQAAWAWIQGNIIPLLQTLWDWFQNYLANAIAYYSALWSQVLLPAIQAVWDFILNVLWPLFVAVAEFLGAVFGLVIQALAAVWTNLLLPALTAVWTFITTNVLPLFQAVASFIGAVFNLALTVMAGIWQNVLRPAIQTVFEWIANKLQPAFAAIAAFWTGTVIPIIQNLSAWFLEHLTPALATVGGWIQDIIGWFNDLTESIQNIKLPDWLEPGSPTPFELGLRGIADAMSELIRGELPAFSAQMNLLPEGAGAQGNIYNYYISNAGVDAAELERIQHRQELLYGY
jgi:hypothetical protein